MVSSASVSRRDSRRLNSVATTSKRVASDIQRRASPAGIGTSKARKRHCNSTEFHGLVAADLGRQFNSQPADSLTVQPLSRRNDRLLQRFVRRLELSATLQSKPVAPALAINSGHLRATFLE